MEKHTFEALYKEYFPLVFRRCFQLLRNREEAENASNTVFEKLFGTKEAIEYPKSYLYRMATNMGIKQIKHRRKEIHLLYAKATNISLNRVKEKGEVEIWEIIKRDKNLEVNIFDWQFDQIEADLTIKAVLKEEDEVTRDIFFMRYYDDMPFEQIGDIVGLGKSAVEKRLNKLRKTLKQNISKDYK